MHLLHSCTLTRLHAYTLARKIVVDDEENLSADFSRRILGVSSQNSSEWRAAIGERQMASKKGGEK
jgi:hypothetical protein